MNRIESIVTDISKPLAEEMGLELVDVEYLKEGDSSYLRIYLYKEEGLSLDDCQDFTKAINPILDEKDPIPENYFLEVSSPGLDRPLKSNRDLERNIGKDVEIGTYAPVDGRKNFVGELISFDDEEIIIKESEELIKLKRKDISKINLAIIF
ncbi:MAG: ribosome maturation factor RimP [Andreesenia angusta]|nr:ribosome maturation factor RimP [Andreesenia angusta]